MRNYKLEKLQRLMTDWLVGFREETKRIREKTKQIGKEVERLRVLNYEGFTTETRERLRNKFLRIMDDMEAEVVCGDVEPFVVSGTSVEGEKNE